MQTGSVAKVPPASHKPQSARTLADQALLRVLAVFQGPFALEAACAVSGRGNSRSLQNALAKLHGNGAILQETFLQTEWYRVPTIVRATYLSSSDPDEVRLVHAASQRHCVYYAQLASNAGPSKAGPEALRHQFEDLLAAFRFAVQYDNACALDLAAVLDPILVGRGPGALHRSLLEQTLALPLADGEHPARASKRVDLMLGLGRVFALGGAHSLALLQYDQAVRLAERVRDFERVGWGLVFRCFSLRARNQKDAACVAGTRARTIALALRDDRLMAASEQQLGVVELTLGDLRSAALAFGRALVAARASGVERLQGAALANLAQAHMLLGDLGRADDCLREAARAFNVAGDHFHLARVQALAAAVSVERRAPHAKVTLDSALAAVVAQGDIEGELEVLAAQVRSVTSSSERVLALARLESAIQRTDACYWQDRLAGLAAESCAPRPPTMVLKLTRDGTRVDVCGRTLDFSRRGPLRRLVLALARARELGAVISVSEMLHAGWPGERMRLESGTSRVYMSVLRLRQMGFQELVVTGELGYAFRSEVSIDWTDSAGSC
jgi:tetratricopeptide (TPR) repeat protein